MAPKPSIVERVVVALVVILLLLWLPFDVLFRWIGRLLPGAREREGRAAEHAAQNDAKKAAALVAALAPDRPDLAQAAAGETGDDLWNATIDALRDVARIGVIDWRSEPDELREALDPMLARHGTALDWTFLEELEARGDWKAIRNDNLIPRVGREIAKLGLVLAHIDEGSDAYMMAVCTPAEFAKIDGLRIDNGAIRIGRFR